MAKGIEKERIAVLINRAIHQNITPDERDELFARLANPQNRAYAEQLLGEMWEHFSPGRSIFTQEQGVEMLQGIMNQHHPEETPSSEIRAGVAWRWWAAAASVMIVASLAVYLFLSKETANSPELTLAEAVEQAGIKPGKDRATITLGDGRTLVLDEAGSGLMAEEAGVSIQKLTDGQVRYEPAMGHVATATTHHTIVIPRGGHCQLVLPDGSKVHLNSESVLKYPVPFEKHERVVALEGEAYFEVNRQSGNDTKPTVKDVPFKVVGNGQVVEVLGTVFNVKAYPGNDVRTALVDGSVRVSNTSGASALLKPGEVAVFTRRGGNFTVGRVDLDVELAWHNGYFLFNDEAIESIMERVARWYDVEVEYRGDLSDKRFGGIFKRSKSIVQLLENLKDTGLITFHIEGRRIIVMEN
ncbi:FecR family protein [Parapedobacter tibetensis]|uniref:FecR family protein n=1 Tax=Parapedobacter tibetensis TaxID=2972951 RepID=UPI00214DA11C|nr:FecR domain-containing protein [Parapedobacter tibetensis]